MTTVTVVTLLVVLVAVLALVTLVLATSRPRLVRSRLRSRVVVSLKSGEAFDGVLYSTDSHVWVLRDSHALGAGDKGTNVAVDGEILIFVKDIDYAQRP